MKITLFFCLIYSSYLIYSIPFYSSTPPPLPPAARGYPQRKVQENVQCEIMGVIAEEARESYAEGAVHALPSNRVEEMESNVERLAAWAAAWTPPAAPGQG